VQILELVLPSTLHLDNQIPFIPLQPFSFPFPSSPSLCPCPCPFPCPCEAVRNELAYKKKSPVFGEAVPKYDSQPTRGALPSTLKQCKRCVSARKYSSTYFFGSLDSSSSRSSSSSTGSASRSSSDLATFFFCRSNQHCKPTEFTSSYELQSCRAAELSS
jgi:hypothetical protein